MRTWLSAFSSIALLCAALLLPATGQATESARTLRQSVLRDTPSNTGRPVASLAPDTDVRVLSRQAGWTQIDVAGQQGWLVDTDLQLPYALKSASPPPRSGFLSWFTAVLKPVAARARAGDSATSRVSTATIGIRGLAEDGALAAPSNSEELQKLKLYSVSRLDAEDFGRNGQLAQSNVPYID